MQETVYRVIEVLCGVVSATPILRQAQDDESGAAAPAVEAGERALAGDAGGGDPRAERDRVDGAGGASGVGGAGAGGLDERRAAHPVAAAGGAGRCVAGARV